MGHNNVGRGIPLCLSTSSNDHNYRYFENRLGDTFTDIVSRGVGLSKRCLCISTCMNFKQFSMSVHHSFGLSIQSFTDNMTVIYYVNRQRRAWPNQLCWKVMSLWYFCIRESITLWLLIYRALRIIWLTISTGSFPTVLQVVPEQQSAETHLHP